MRRALIVIDVQNEYVDGNLRIEFPDIGASLTHIGAAIDAAHEAGIPVVVVDTIAPAEAPIFAAGTHGAELHPVVAGRTREHYISKKLPSSFAGTGLREWLEEHGIETIAVAGFMTHNCDFSTIVDAAQAGFAAEFLSDASGSVPYANRAGVASAGDLHRAFTVVMQSRFAAVMTTEEWIAAVKTGAAPERDTIFGSNQRALSLGACA